MADFKQISLIGIVQGNNTIWTTPGNVKIPIIDGKIKFYDHNLQAYFEIAVAQIKGQGTSSANRLHIVGPKHKQLLKVLLELTRPASSEAIMAIASRKIGKFFKEQHFRGTLSELLKKRAVIINSDQNPPVYYPNIEYAQKCLETGKFE